MKITADSKITYDPVSLLVDGKRWFPMMGEMHFSRYPARYWEEELCKMKAGGIDIVSLYVIWIHHEEIHGEFDFTGDRNLRLFLETVKKCGLYSILRIGPWAHGEARNGGFPDWLLKDSQEAGYEVRTDAPQYLSHVRKFYEKTYEQAKGFFIKDGGPVIGIQIENEYGHCGGKGGEEGEQHMRTLLAMAKEIGFDTPIYTATGWGGAVTGGMLPVMGGYCEAPWDPRVTEIEPSGNYIFTRERNDHNIGSDHGLGAGITFDMDKFPFLTAELGGGLQVTRHRRPIACGTDTAAMTMVKMGSGANLLGYYMYHGGSNPEGKLTTLQESTETGYPNDLPVRSYDFNAPLREYGQMEDTYRQVRLIAMFVHDFGDDLCDMAYTEQPGNPLKPDNLTALRTAVRYKHVISEGNDYVSGYLFVNNYQRRYEMATHRDVTLKVHLTDDVVLTQYEKRDIENGDFFFYPFFLPVGDKALITIDATPMCIIHDYDGKGHDVYVFYTDNDREAVADILGSLSGHKIMVLTKEEALSASKVTVSGKEHLFISEGDIVCSAQGEPYLYFNVADEEEKKPVFKCFPEPEKISDNFEKKSGAKEIPKSNFADSDVFAVYEGKEEYTCSAKASCPENTEQDQEQLYKVMVTDIPCEPNEIFMEIEYEGDKAEMYRDGKLIADSFYTGQLWEIGLKRFIDSEERRLSSFEADIDITPLYEDSRVYLQDWPKLRDGKACDLVNIHLISQYRVKV